MRFLACAIPLVVPKGFYFFVLRSSEPPIFESRALNQTRRTLPAKRVNTGHARLHAIQVEDVLATSRMSDARGGCNRSTRRRERIYRGHRVYAARHKEDNHRLIGSLRLKRMCSIKKKLYRTGFFVARVLVAIYQAISGWRNVRGKPVASISPSDLCPILRRKSTFETCQKVLTSCLGTRINVCRLKIRCR